MPELRNISVRYAAGGRPHLALDRLSLAFSPGSITCVVGRSGCGKTTLLRVLAGLQAPTAGQVDRGDARRLGYVFQEPRLMPWLTVRENIAFGLPRPAEQTARIDALLQQIGLTAFAGAWPAQLSGGMASRVALARALAPGPDLLLMDEPFAALDAFTRRTLQTELVRLWQAHRPTMVFITHDVEEAVLLGERVVELAAGRVIGIHPVPLPFPRDPTDPALVDRRRAVLDRLMHPSPAEVLSQ